MTRNEIDTLLRPGDCLLYKPHGLAGILIQAKTWHRVAHVEVYTGNGKAVASRDGVGVGIYPWRSDDLAYVLRPTYPLDWVSFWRWFRTVNGQRYDWWGLLRFAWFTQTGAGKNNRMFCSEFAARAYRYLGAHVFGDVEDADAVAPFEFLLSPNLTVIGTPLSLR